MTHRYCDVLILNCNICDCEYKDINDLTNHLKTHEHNEHIQGHNDADIMSLVCVDCKYETNKKHHMLKHINSVTHFEMKDKNSNINKYGSNYICKLCNKYFSNRSNYTKHLKTGKHKLIESLNYNPKNSTPQYVCICGKGYSYKKALDGHIKNCKKHISRHVYSLV